MTVIGCYCKRPECRPGRPLCRRTDNPRNVTCTCDHYHYPHRAGSGRCVQNPEGMARMWKAVDTPMRRRTG